MSGIIEIDPSAVAEEHIEIALSETVVQPVPSVAALLPFPPATAKRSLDDVLQSQESSLELFRKKKNIEEVQKKRAAFIEKNLTGFLNQLGVPATLRSFSQPDLNSASPKVRQLAETNVKACKHDPCGEVHVFSGAEQVSRHMKLCPAWDSASPNSSTFRINAYLDNITLKNQHGEMESFNLNHLAIDWQRTMSGINFNQYENFLTPQIWKAIADSSRVGETVMRTKIFPQNYLMARDLVRQFFNPSGCLPRLFSLIFDESTNCGKKVLSVVAVEYTSSAVLGVAVVDPSQPSTADELLRKVDGILQSFSLDWKSVVSVCSDNGPDSKGARLLIHSQHPFVLCVPCLSHGLALVSTCIFGPKTKTKCRPFSDVHEFLVLFHSYFFGRGQTNQRRSRLSRCFGPSFVTAMDFVETRWGTLLHAAITLDEKYTELWNFLEAELVVSENQTSVAMMFAQIRTSSLRLSLSLLRTVFGGFVDLIARSQHSIADLNDSGNLLDLISSHQFFHNHLLSASKGLLDNTVIRSVRSIFPANEVEEQKDIWLKKMREAGKLAHNKFLQRVQPTLEVMKIKACLDPILLHEISVVQRLLPKWYDLNKKSCPLSCYSPSAPACYPDFILDPFADRLVAAERISRSARAALSSQWNCFHAAVQDFIANSSSPSRVKKFAFGGPVSVSPIEPAPEPGFVPTTAKFWEETSADTFRHIKVLAENAALLIVSNAEVERGFNCIRLLLPSTRQGVILDENFEKEFFLRANERFFKTHGLNRFK